MPLSEGTACIPAPVGGQLRKLLDSYGNDLMTTHQDMLKAKHQVDILTRYHELRTVPAGLVFPQETHIKDPAPWFTKEWRQIENKAALEKTNLLIHHWKEAASHLEGNALKAKYSRVHAIKQAEIDQEAKTGLLNELSRAEETLLPDKEAMEEKQKRLTEAYLNKLVGPAKVHAIGSRPGLGAVVAQTKATKSTYAQTVANKGKGPAPSKKPPTSSAKVVEDKSTPVVAFNTNAATTPVETAQGSMGFVEALFDQRVLMHKCLSSQQGLSGGCNFATAEGDEGNHPRDGIHQEGEARNTTSSPLSPTEVNEGTRSSPGTAVGVGRQHPPHARPRTPRVGQGTGDHAQVPTPLKTGGNMADEKEAAALEKAEVSGEGPNQVLSMSRM